MKNLSIDLETRSSVDIMKSGVYRYAESPDFDIVQAVCRDLLADTMKNLRQYRIVGHVHDEVIIETPKDTSTGTITDIMGHTPEWIQGLELRGDGSEAPFYRKS